jgi:ligand-binding SRPBCC domain-containing protein
MITIRSHSGIYTLEVKQFIGIPIAEAWDFFSSPGNLSKITPEQMGFIITSGAAGKMYTGQIITYKVSPFPGFTTNWVTEITHVSEGRFFVDEQRFGPYSMWHHEHHFEVQGNGVLMTDRVSYKLPFGFLGRIAHFIFVKKQLRQIFEYREKFLEQAYKQS